MLIALSMLKPSSKPGENRPAEKRLGMGQLTLVEHSLCPLVPGNREHSDRVHVAQYHYTDQHRKRQTATARVFAPLGLLPNDELYLWGLLGLTLSQSNDERTNDTLIATPDWCLKQLGLIDTKSRRGGRQYRQFCEALQRLSAVTYLSDACYDPSRQEYRRVSFSFLSYSLPLDPDSRRMWTIHWDRSFFDLIKASGGYMRFDVETYRQLDFASRRLFLLLLKIGYRNGRIPTFDLYHLSINLLGFSPSLAVRDMRVKVDRILLRLREASVIDSFQIARVGVSKYQVQMEAGSYMRKLHHQKQQSEPIESPLAEGLINIGFDEVSARAIVKRYPSTLVTQWTDITLAALEKYGKQHFRKSPMAFMLDSLQKAAKGERTPPDWWLAIRKQEQRAQEPSLDGKKVLSKLMDEVFGANRSAADEKTNISPMRSILKSIV